jgi:hypothetical protein
MIYLMKQRFGYLASSAKKTIHRSFYTGQLLWGIEGGNHSDILDTGGMRRMGFLMNGCINEFCEDLSIDVFLMILIRFSPFWQGYDFKK